MSLAVEQDYRCGNPVETPEIIGGNPQRVKAFFLTISA
jgi:hypothetical protein